LYNKSVVIMYRL